MKGLALAALAGILAAHEGEAGKPGPARIKIDVTRPAKPISRRLYGKFTEHLGRNIYGGMWAQVLSNPGFEQASFFGAEAERRAGPRQEGVAPFWAPLSAAPAEFRLEADCALPEQSAQSIAAEKVEPGSEVGLKQAEVYLPLHRESDYRLSFRARGERLERGFVMSIRREKETLARAEFPAPRKDWERRSARLTIPSGTVPAGTPLDFTIEVLSTGKLVLDLVELFPEDALDGFDPDIIGQCREARLPLLRYPGGNFVSGYRWKDGIGPRELRPMRKNPAWNMGEPNHVGTDEFLSFCRAADCEPMICVNAGNGTPEEAAAWVEYTNGAVTTVHGSLRARNGHPEPYGIKVWEVGNELYGDWQIGHATATEYVDRYLRFARAMTAADPAIALIANGNDPPWNRVLLDRAGASIRSLSVHPLIGGGTPPGADPEKTFRALMAYPTAFEREARSELEWATRRGFSPRIAITELQIFTNRDPLPTNATLSEALWLGRFIHTAIRLDGAVEMITHSALVNHGGGLQKRRGVVFAQPVQFAHRLYGTMTGVRPVPVEVTCGRYSSKESHITAVDGAPDLDAVALLDGLGRELTMVVINTRAEGEITSEIEVSGGSEKAIRARRIDGPAYMTRNSAEEPEAAALREIEPPMVGEHQYRFPAHSITEIVFGQ